MIVLGTGHLDDYNDIEGENDLLTLKMIELLEQHGWSFTYGRDPLLILIELEEINYEN